MWCIPPKQDAAFVCAMETVLDVYKRPYDPKFPVVCMDETSKQCVKEVRSPQPMTEAHPVRYDAEYERNGVAHLLLYYAPFKDWRRIDVGEDHKAETWAHGIRRLVEEDFHDAERITLVMDNLNTHTGASLYKTFAPEVARRLMEKLEFIYTPKHGSWLNIAENEFSVLSRQCLNRRIPDINTVAEEVITWCDDRNQNQTPVQWRFTTDDARVKLHHLYPCLLD